jgi:N-acyl-L-homoserine lactone synthetase
MFNPQTLSAQQSVHTTASLEMSSLANIFWSRLTDYRVVQSVDLLSLLMATLLSLVLADLLSTTDAMRNAHIQESTIRLSNYYLIE